MTGYIPLPLMNLINLLGHTLEKSEIVYVFCHAVWKTLFKDQKPAIRGDKFLTPTPKKLDKFSPTHPCRRQNSYRNKL